MIWIFTICTALLWFGMYRLYLDIKEQERTWNKILREYITGEKDK